jgi:DNA polymerase III delta prime subunit
METYRAKQHAQYLERERLRIEAEQIEKDLLESAENEAREKLERATKILIDCQEQITGIRQHTSMVTIRKSVDTILETITENKDILEKDALGEIAMSVVDAINNNNNTITNLNIQQHMDISRQVQTTIKKLLLLCEVIQDTEELDVDYDMDCSRDEEIALQLSRQQLIDTNDPPPRQRRPRGRPRKVPRG